MCKVTVVIPVYNVEQYLPACLDSVLSQSLKEIEVICIDDASPDRCGEILDAYAARDGRVRVLHLPENRMQGYGRNRGIEMAEGRYIYLLDSDDMITADAMEKLYGLAERDSLDAVFFDSQVICESEAMRKKSLSYPTGRNGSYEDRILPGAELFERFIQQKDWNCYIQRQFWNRDFLVSNDVWFPQDGVEHEDEFFSFKGILLARRARYIPERFFIRRYRENSVMTREKNCKDFHGYFMNYCAMVDFVERCGIRGPGVEKNIAHMYEWMILTYGMFAAQEDPEAWFPSEHEKSLYRFFAHSQKSELIYANHVRFLLGEISDFRHIWVYGAGIIGKNVLHLLHMGGRRIDGFLVTSRANNPEILLDHPVKTIDELPASPDTAAVVAVSAAYRDEICKTLDERGWNYAVYYSGRS